MEFFKPRIIKKQDTSSSSSQELTWPDHVVTLDEKTFDTFIHQYPFVVVDFWASWCSPCKAIVPRIRRLSKIYQNKVAFGKLDVQKNKNVADKYRVLGIPHFILFHHGDIHFTMTGVRSIGKLKDTIDDMVKNKGRYW